MSVHQLKDGRWIVRFKKGTLQDDPNRTRVYFGRGFLEEQKARQFNEKLDLRSWTRRTPKESSPLFFELVNVYIEAKIGTMEKTTKENFMIKMRSVILPELGQTQAIKITRRRLDRYISKRLQTVRRARIRYGPQRQFVKIKTITDGDGNPAKIKRSTVRRELIDIQAVLNWAAQEKYLTHNPAAGHKKPKGDESIIMPPTPEEISRLLEYAPKHLVRALVLSYYCGIRPGQSELFKIKWTSVDFKTRTIFIRSAKKNGPRTRTVPLHDKFVNILKQWYNEDKQNGAGEFIIHYYGKPIKRIAQAFRSAKKKAGIVRRLRPYDFRHAFATYALGRHADLKATSEILGHSRPDTTTRIYQHVDSRLKRDVIDRLPALDWK